MASRDQPPSSDGIHVGRLYRHIYAVVRRIPRGKVATYGQVAELAGIPGAARVVGAAMRALPSELGLPWQRVVGKRSPTLAQVAILDPVGAGIQRAMLEAEGVVFTTRDAIRLADHGWLPGDRPRGRRQVGRSRERGRGSARGR